MQYSICFPFWSPLPESYTWLATVTTKLTKNTRCGHTHGRIELVLSQSGVIPSAIKVFCSLFILSGRPY